VITAQVIEACKAKNVKNLIYTSSIMVALTFADGFKSEKNVNIKHNAPQSGESVDIYAKTKAEAEALVMEESKSNKLKVCLLSSQIRAAEAEHVCESSFSAGVRAPPDGCLWSWGPGLL